MPPFGRLASILISGTDRAAENHAREVARAAARRHRVPGTCRSPARRYPGPRRYRLLVKAPREADIQAYIRLWMENAPKARGSLRLSIDIDPYNFL